MSDIYRITSDVKTTYCYVIFSTGVQDKLSGLIWENPTKERIDPRWIISGVAQSGLTDDLLRKIDYLHAPTALPLFSRRFVETVGAEVGGDLDYVPCQVVSESGVVHEFFIGRIHVFLPLVNMPATELGEGKSALSPVVFNESKMDFYISRDMSRKTLFVVSDKFKALCEKYRLRIRFADVETSFK